MTQAALQITRPVLLINLLLVPVHALLTYLLVERSRLGYLGAGELFRAAEVLWRGEPLRGVLCRGVLVGVSTPPAHARGRPSPRPATF